MKRFILVLMLVMAPFVCNAGNDKKPHETWRDRVFALQASDGPIFYIIDPTGRLWFYRCTTTPSGQTHCQFKRA